MKNIPRLAPTILGVALLLAPAGQAQAQTATVNLDSQKQYIRGFGGMNHPVWAGDLTDAQRLTAFGNGSGQLGMTVLRIWVSDNKNDWTKEVATAKRAIELGALVYATPWNPPSNLTTTVGGAKSIDPSKFAAYTDHLNSFVSYMKGQGVDLYAIAVQNEPDYAAEWTKWTQDNVYQFVLNYGSKITTKLITAESFNYTKSFYDKILNDPAALANIAILGTHLYGTQVSAFPYPLFDQKGTGKERWMTEHYTDSNNDADLWPMALDVAYELHNSMVEGQFNLYTWWYIRRKYGPIKENGQISKRGYCMAQYSKFIRPGFVRVDATKNPTSGVYVSAYKGPAGDVVVAIVNRNTSSKTLSISIPGASASSFERYTTSGSKNLVSESAVKASNGALSVDLDAQSVTTLYAKGSGGAGGAGGTAGAGGSAGSGGSAGGGGSAGSSASGGSAGTAGAGGSASAGAGGRDAPTGGTGGSSGAGGNGGSTGGRDAGAAGSAAGGSGGTKGEGGSASGGSQNEGGSTGGSVAAGGHSGATGGSKSEGGASGNGGTKGEVDSGGSDGGCSYELGRAGGATGLAALLVLPLLAWIGRRRRRS